MRELKTVLAGLLIVTTMAGCGFRDRRWGACALGGGLAGAALGGLGGGLGVDRVENGPDNGERAAGAGAGFVTGAVLGALLGHVICDPMEEAPPPPPVAAPAPPPPPKGTKIATIGGAQFDFNKAAIKPAGRDVLDKAVKTLKDNPDLRVVVEGHTDSIGSEAYNQKLSERRAEAVRAYLVSQGIAASRISTRGYGKTRPVASNKTEAGRAENRRAEIIAD
jgi:OOP family OmpA-OmpF porin